ncbi:hypothetical protein [Streptomyces canus]|uniref:hypothetical protein n=1 Tax=Streptomyces canus TaxID=58343 RepID=UPI002B1E61A1|nr:hypothetical protein [Streptomyces canus]
MADRRGHGRRRLRRRPHACPGRGRLDDDCTALVEAATDMGRGTYTPQTEVAAEPSG